MNDPATVLLSRVLPRVRDRALEAGVFGSCEHPAPDVLVCHALASAEPAHYVVFAEMGRVYVALQTPARYLSQSIEADLVHSGDKLEDLLMEELLEQGYEGKPLPVEHFRTEDKLYTFRSPVPIASGASDADADALLTKCLLAYEACFRRLGDMEAGGDD
jgi:hypothetical protein